MPRGVPKAGFRMTMKRQQSMQSGEQVMPNFLMATQPSPVQAEVVNKTFDEIKQEVSERFTVMEEIALSTAMGINPSLIIGGAAGVGKSHTVMSVIDSLGVKHSRVVKGSVTPVGLFRLLYDYRHEGSLLVFDDCDSVWDDDVTLNLLKAATDTTDKRTLSWHSSRQIYDEDGNEVPSDFEFNGNIIFISNIDFYRESKGNGRMAPHFAAMISRSFVLDVAMKNEEYYLARIHHVLFDCMDESEFNHDTKSAVFNFMTENKATLRELSLRMVKKISVLMKTYPNGWQDKAKVLLCRY